VSDKLRIAIELLQKEGRKNQVLSCEPVAGFLADKALSPQFLAKCGVEAFRLDKTTYGSWDQYLKDSAGAGWRELGLGAVYKYALHRLPFLIIPYPSIAGDQQSLDSNTPWTSVKFRPCLSREDAKRLNLPPSLLPSRSSSPSIYAPLGIDASKDWLLLVEGESDCWTALQNGCTCVALSSATASLPDAFLDNLRGLHLPVYVLPDRDDAGTRAMQEAARLLVAAGVQVTVCELPQQVDDTGEFGKDLNDLMRALPPERRDNWTNLLQPVSVDEFLSRESTSSELPSINITNRQLREVVDEAWGALQRSNEPPSLFIRDDDLVMLRQSHVDDDDEAGVLTTTLSKITMDTLRGELLRCADWVRSSHDSTKATMPGSNMIRDMLAHRPFPDWLQRISIVTTSPAYAPDMKLLASGFHSDLRLFHAPSMDISPPTTPTEEQLQYAIGEIKKLLKDFPFRSDADHANAIAALLLSILRPAITGAIPLLFITATIQRSGKSCLARIVEVLTTGVCRSGVQFSPNEEELRKALLAYLTSGQPVIRFDNIRDGAKIDSPHLASALTEGHYRDRKLCTSETVGCPVTAIFAATGNNLTLSRDLQYRALPIKLSPQTDQPQKREFTIPEIERHVAEFRAEYLTHLATMVEHWKSDGAPPWSGAPMNGFNEFVSIVGGVLQSCGIDGFLGNLDTLHAEANPEEEEWRQVMQVWRETETDTRESVQLLREVFNPCDPTYIHINGTDDTSQARSLTAILRKRLGTPVSLPSGEVVAIASKTDPTKKKKVYWLEYLSSPKDPTADTAQASQALPIPSPHQILHQIPNLGQSGHSGYLSGVCEESHNISVQPLNESSPAPTWRGGGGSVSPQYPYGPLGSSFAISEEQESWFD